MGQMQFSLHPSRLESDSQLVIEPHHQNRQPNQRSPMVAGFADIFGSKRLRGGGGTLATGWVTSLLEKTYVVGILQQIK
jgi:hypothetical protein